MSSGVNSENEAYAAFLYYHVSTFVERLRQLPRDRWDWQVEVSAPSPRILAVHAWQFLVCDRQHILEPDCSKHADVPEPPAEEEALCDILLSEAETWRTMILGLSPDQLDEPRMQFASREVNVRWLICHMLQNCIYKHGQFSLMYFALGLDGTEPYTAPFPNPIYALMRKAEL